MRALLLTMVAIPVAAAPPPVGRADAGRDAGAADAGEPRGGAGRLGATPSKACALEGVVSFHSPSDVTIDRVVVFVSRGQTAAYAPPQAHVIAQLNQQFVPDVLVIQKNDSVSFPNRDRIEHSVFSTDGTVHIPASTKADPEPVAFARAGSFRIQCNIHSNMRADVLVVPARELHTFVGRDGRWRIDGLTAPQVTVTAWEPNGGEVTQVVSPCDGRPTQLRLEGQRAPLPLRKDGSLYKDYAP